MARPKQGPTHNPNAQRRVGPEANLESKANTNAGPADLLLSYHSNNIELAERLPIAYPSLAQNDDSVYQPLQQPASWQKSWFISRLPVRVRRAIYTHLFSGATEQIVEEVPGRYLCSDEDKVSGILEVCRKTRIEAMPFYHPHIILNIGLGSVPTAWFEDSVKINRFKLRNVQFRAWDPSSPEDLVGHLLDQFPRMTTLIIEAPPAGDHITVNDDKGRYANKANQVPGFRGLLHSRLFQDTLAEISFKSSIPRDQRRDFRQAELAVRTVEKLLRRKHEVKLLLATRVNIYSDMWLSWTAKTGESLKGLILPNKKDVEPHMESLIVLDFVDGVVELKVNHHSLMLDLM